MADVLDLHAAALEILEAAADSLDEIPDVDATLDGAPARQFVSPGLPADDCPMLVVWVDPIGPLPAQRDVKLAAWITAPTFNVTVTRCQPTPTLNGSELILPDPADLTAAALQHNADGWALWNGLHAAVQQQRILAACDKAIFDPAVARDPMGAIGGWTMQIRVTVPGYEALAGS
ncbi:MAG TPA: hypothetical protein VFO73_06615 [Candidatus Limnocylindrales bacterium]|nr:hypothetical protein [Candidatus Limnocylindrales bacterium]